MKLSLLVLTPGKQEGKLLEIKPAQFLVGRDPQCHLRPASSLISKRHCAILQREGKVFIRDFDSTNGTFVNEEPVKGECELRHDDQLKIGPIMFTVRLEADAPATKAAAARTPPPATKPVTKAASSPSTPAPATKGATADDDIAAMLMEIEDGDVPSAGPDGVPEGSTVMELKVPPELMEGGAGKPGAPNSKQPNKSNTGDTRAAAAKLLEQLTRRPRT